MEGPALAAVTNLGMMFPGPPTFGLLSDAFHGLLRWLFLPAESLSEISEADSDDSDDSEII